MTKWIKILAPSLVGMLATFLILIFSGLATSTILNNEGVYVTNTIVGLDVNLFAGVMLLGVFFSVFIAAYAVNR